VLIYGWKLTKFPPNCKSIMERYWQELKRGEQVEQYE